MYIALTLWNAPRVLLLASFCVVFAAALSAGCSGNDPGPLGPDDPEPISENAPPEFRSAPATTVDHNKPYVYRVETYDPNGDAVVVTASTLPPWLAFDPTSRALSGEAGWENISTFDVTLQADDGTETTRLHFSVEVRRGEIICDQDFGDPAASPYILPYPVGQTFSVIQSYCPPNPAWGHNNWFAYDFDTATGDTIIASRGGTVIAMREDNPNTPSCAGGRENFVFILHADGTVMQYVHLTTAGALIEKDERVAQGQPVGISGNSGCSAGPHLHVALFRNRNNFDRQSTLPFNYRNALGPLDSNQGLLQAEYSASAESQ